LIKRKNSLLKAWKKQGTPALHKRYKSARNNVTKMLKSAKKTFFMNLNTVDQKLFWKTVHLLTSNSSSVPVLVHDCGKASTSQEKADRLSEYSSIHPLTFAVDTFGTDLNSCPDDFLCSVEEVQHLLETLDVSKSSGPDGISARMLKPVAQCIAPSVTKLVNQSLQSGCFPVLWKVSNIVPIPKAGDNTNPKCYRPISLLSILSKLLERHVQHLLLDHIMEKNLISDSQWGFVSGRSTTSALLTVIDSWHRHLEAGREICAVFLDLQKAFDSVPHRNLLFVLQQMDVHPTLLKWTCSYLTSRVQRVVVNGATSSEVHAVSGVPQGSVLGPLFFLIYINSASDLGFSPGTHITLYADDILLSKPVICHEDFIGLQTDINSLFQWSTGRRLTFNQEKCKFMLVTRRRNPGDPPVLALGEHAIAQVFQFKYLGVTVTSDLSWGKHIHILCTRAKRMLGLLYRTFYLNTSATSLLQLYISLIRPCLEYACQVWNPHLVKDVEKLEKVQKFALRLCVKQWDLDYSSLLFVCNVPTLATWRKYFNLCTMYKIINQQMFYPPDVFVPRVTPFLPSSTLLYCQPFCRSNSHLYSFVPKTYSDWNLLPLSIRSSDTLSSFKSSLKEWLAM
jgi:hypothetical protein